MLTDSAVRCLAYCLQLQIQNDRSPHLYTLIVRQDNTFTIKIDDKVQKNGHLLENLEPAINPPAEIDDPDDKKPSDWVDDAKIPGKLQGRPLPQACERSIVFIDVCVRSTLDPTASKPDDWDEDAPKTILDEEAVMPEGTRGFLLAATFGIRVFTAH